MSDDRHAIMDLIMRYALAGDSGDFEALGACFAEDGILDLPLARGTGPDGVHAALAAAGETHPLGLHTRHHVTTMVITPAADGKHAGGRVYFIAYTNRGPDHSGVWEDRYVRTGAGWRFAHRTVDIEWQSSDSQFRPFEPHR